MDPTSWNLPLVLVWLIMYGIVLLRAGGTYALGRLARGGLSRSLRVRRLLDSERYAAAEARVSRWGAPIVALSFLTVGFQTVANLAAGTIRMPLLRYLPALALGGAAWASVYSLVGFAGFAAVRFAFERAPAATGAAGAVIVVLIALLVLIPVRRRRRTGAAETGAGPAPEESAGRSAAGTAGPGESSRIEVRLDVEDR
ncbi:DedA family protein [Brevibacterium album]|uniref:DedA family protein n=1 Tax=Brevibacterium album TaxID=417948 RepID=UPI0003FC5A10|nr:VTT domain-containing protein [Brevibacterium album]